MRRYTVSLNDCAGEFDSYTTDSFAEVLCEVALYAGSHPQKVVTVTNWDRADYDTDGLTEEEREAIDDAIDGARGVA